MSTAPCYITPFLQQESYSLLSRQSLPSGKPIDELVLIPYMSRMLILSGKQTLLSHSTPPKDTFKDRQIHFYTLPSLDPVPNIKPIRHVETLVVDQHHLLRAPPTVHDIANKLQPLDFCVMKRSAIAIYSLYEERLVYSRVSSSRFRGIPVTVMKPCLFRKFRFNPELS